MPDEKLLPLPPLHALRTFHAAARFGRFREAAAALGLSELAVSHQVRKLEEYLGLALFEKAGNQVRLTSVGASYFEAIDPALTAIRKATDALAGPSFRVALTLPASLATLWLIPHLARLEAAYPEIVLQLITTTRLTDLRREQIDLAIRYGKGEWAGLTAEHLFDEIAYPVCRPGFLEGERDAAKAIGAARLILNSAHPEEWTEWAKAHGLEPPSVKGAILLDASEQVLTAATEGLGLAIGRQPMVERYLADGRLVAPFGRDAERIAGYYLAYPADRELSVSARRVARWLREIAGAGAAQPAPKRSKKGPPPFGDPSDAPPRRKV